jgi:ParB-like chromosome segregation protein Spo0J
MYSIQTHDKLVLESKLVDASKLLPHEEVVIERLSALMAYLDTLKPYAIVPSILVCDKTDVIIDGHHRFYALQKLGFDKIPVTYLNYNNAQIVPDLDERVTKLEIIKTAQEGRFMPPKTSFHHVLDYKGVCHPLILLSVLFKLDMK